jgi:Flp pilus assembly pilin Flp
MATMYWAFEKLCSRDGQGLVEYSLILLLVAMAILIALSGFGVSLTGLYNQIASILPF